MVVGGRELIDTLWNVNTLAPPCKASSFIELIDTLWNVNSSVIAHVPDAPVELIDTLWNVNAKKLGQIAGGVFELIDTLWNVNYLPSVSNFEPIARINRYIMECKWLSL